MVAAGPGESLPEFPTAICSETPDLDGLKPMTSANSILNSIPRNATNHNTRGADRANRDGSRFPIWDGEGLVPFTVCTDGFKKNVGRRRVKYGVPDGSRDVTIREHAAIQGFPHNHKFNHGSLTDVRKIIGNAFPSTVAKVVFKAVRKQLEKTDAAYR